MKEEAETRIQKELNLSFGFLVVNQFLSFSGRIQVFKNSFPVIPHLCSYFGLASFSSTWWPNWPLVGLRLNFHNRSG